MSIKEHVDKVLKKEIDIISYTKEVIEKVKKINKEYDCFVEISEDLALEQAKKIAKSIDYFSLM